MNDGLKGRYGFSVAFSMVVGVVIGIGIFFKATPVLKAAGLNPKIAVSAWALGGIISILSGLTAAEIGAAVPETGGIIAWIRRVYGDKLAFLVGWTQAVIYQPAIVALIAYYFAFFTTQFLGVEAVPKYMFPISAGAIILVFAINTFTEKAGGIVQTIATGAKVIPLIAITIFGFMSNNNSAGIFYTSSKVALTSKSPILLLGMALVPVMFAFDGWMYVGTISGDLKNVRKDLPKAIIFGIGFITIMYMGLNVALLKVFPAEEIVNQGMFGVAKNLFGHNGAKIIFLGIMISAFGGLNGFSLISTRVPYSLAIEGHFPAKDYFSKVDDKNSQPIRSAGLMFILVMVYLVAMFITGNPDVFGDVPVAIFWFFYSMVFLGVIILRNKEPKLERPYRVPLYPIIPILAMLGGISIAIYASISEPRYMLISLIAALSGLLFYKK
jgi:APA family basic amino acid/polyamine antiporter